MHRSVMFASQSGVILSPAAQNGATGPDGKARPRFHLQGSCRSPQMCNLVLQHSHRFTTCRQAAAIEIWFTRNSALCQLRQAISTQADLAGLRLAVRSHPDLLTATHTSRSATMWKLLMVPDRTCCAISAVSPAMKPSRRLAQWYGSQLSDKLCSPAVIVSYQHSSDQAAGWAFATMLCIRQQWFDDSRTCPA